MGCRNEISRAKRKEVDRGMHLRMVRPEVVSLPAAKVMEVFVLGHVLVCVYGRKSSESPNCKRGIELVNFNLNVHDLGY